MGLITISGNVDYLITDVRLRLGDLDAIVYSDAIVRTAIIAGIKFLQTKWQRRYQIYSDAMYVIHQPTDVSIPVGKIYAALQEGYNYIPSGLAVNDVFRNPFQTFDDVSLAIITQQDEYPVILAALLFLRENLLSANQQKFVNWSDGEYSLSNVSSATVMRGLSADTLAELNAYFKVRRAAVLRGDFTNFVTSYPYYSYTGNRVL